METMKTWEEVETHAAYLKIVLRKDVWVYKTYTDGVIDAAPGAPMVKSVFGELTTSEVSRALAPRKMPVWCQGGTVRVMSDIWESCRGCAGCSVEPKAVVAWAVGAWVWSMAHLAEHKRLAACNGGLAALALVGAAVAAAGTVGAGVSAFLADTVTIYNTPAKGAWFKVTGKRGKAKEFNGLVGECVWVGESTYSQERPIGWRGTWRGRVSTTKRVGLKVEGREKPVYVPASTVERMPMPSDVARALETARTKAVAAIRPSWKGATGRRGDTGYVVAGKHKGRSGLVFWARDGRLGLKETQDSEPMWCQAVDVIGPASWFSAEEHADPVAAAELAMLALDAAGHVQAAAAWGAVASCVAA